MDFLSASIKLIRRHASKARATGDYEFVHLAAHLFAIGQQLLASHGNARFGVSADPSLRPSESLDDLLLQLEELPSDLSIAALFQALTGALDWIANHLAEDEPLPARTQVEAISAGDRFLLGGVVHHWMRPLSVLAWERRFRYDGAGEGRPPSPAPTLDSQQRRLAFFWESDPQLPRFYRVVPPRRPAPLFNESGPEAERHRRFRVALCPLKGIFHPHFQIHPENQAFFRINSADSMKERATLHEHLEAVLETARQEEIHLLVFPELTVDPEALRHVSGLLKKANARFPFGVAAGSFHVWNAGSAGDWNGPLPSNELVLLDHTGTPLAVHRKRGRFRILSKFLAVPSPLFPGEPENREGLPREIFEDIEYGSELQILDTTLGRLAFLICADAIAPDDFGYLPLVRRLRPDLLIVAAMSHETEPFDTFAAEMSRHWIGTLVVNAHCICEATARPPAPPPNLAACDLAFFESRGAAPTRVRWQYGCCEAQCRYYKPANQIRDWQEAVGAPAPTGISWLGGKEERLGLVIDLGSHCTAG